MKTFLRLADSKPLIFSLLTLLIWIVIAGLVNSLLIFLFRMPRDNPIIVQTGNLVAACMLLYLMQRLGWLREIGITRPGAWLTWLITLAMAVYIVVIGFYAFFEEIAFSFNSLGSTQEARTLLASSLLAGFIEETVFRGVLLYLLIRVWGKTRRGILASIIVQAALFGILHILQILSGVSTDAALANMLGTFIFGVTLGVFVLFGGTLWPAIVLHAASNAFILIKGLSSPWSDPVSVGFLKEALLEIPLALLCLWIMLRKLPVQKSSSHTNPETSISA
jgi:membrane protease YdiL (CAAX protease family)